MTDNVSLVIPTLDRQRYLPAAIGDLLAQTVYPARFEIVVVDDSPTQTSRALVEKMAMDAPALRYVPRDGGPGLNSCRNTGLAVTQGDLIVFVDDDCRFPKAWLAALLRGVEAAPSAECFGGPIQIWIEPGHPRWCGREPFPISSLDHGAVDRYVDVVYGANMAVTRSAIDRIGPFDADYRTGAGDEVEWIMRLRRHGGLVRYVAAAAVTHTRLADDVALGRLARVANVRGRHTAMFDREQGLESHLIPTFRRAVRMSAHAVTSGCWGGAAHAAEAYVHVFHGLRARSDH